jgi:transposase-like protein
MGKPKDIPVEEKEQAIMAMLRREEPITRIARRVGVSEVTMHRWRDEFLSAGKAALSAKGSGRKGTADRVKTLEKSLAERDQVIGELTIANRILKKTADGLY